MLEERERRFDRAAFSYEDLIGEPKTIEWTPTLTFTTAGDQSFTYSIQFGRAVRVGPLVFGFMTIGAVVTHTTAAGSLAVTGFPFKVRDITNLRHMGALRWGGITKANYTDIVMQMSTNAASISFSASGSGVAASTVAAADVPTGGTLVLQGTIVALVQ